MLKKIFFAAFLIVSSLASAQRGSFVPHSDNIYIQGLATTQYKSPMFGIMGERSVPVENSKFTILLKPGVWLNPFIPKSNFWVLQMGLTRKINKSVEVGAYFMNLNAFLPKPFYNTQKEVKNNGYNSPLSVFVTAAPFKDKKYSVTAEYSYFSVFAIRNGGQSYNKSGFTVSLNYKLFEHIAKEKKKK